MHIRRKLKIERDRGWVIFPGNNLSLPENCDEFGHRISGGPFRSPSQREVKKWRKKKKKWRKGEERNIEDRGASWFGFPTASLGLPEGKLSGVRKRGEQASPKESDLVKLQAISAKEISLGTAVAREKGGGGGTSSAFKQRALSVL